MFPDEDALRKQLVDWFEEAEEASYHARVKAERDHDYYDGKQLTELEYKKLQERGQPPVVMNLIRRKIDFLLGLEARQRSDPKAYPRTPMDGDSAEVVTQTLRYVSDNTDYHQKRARVWKDMLVPGWGGVQLMVKGARRADPLSIRFGFAPNPDLVIKRTAWDRMFWDPYSTELDFSDARYRGLVIWKDVAEAVEEYPEAADVLRATVENARFSETYDDKPRRTWADYRRKRVRIIQIWWKQAGSVYWAEVIQNAILAGGETPYVNEHGEPSDSFVWRSAYVDRDNNRHGVVRDMVDPQDEVNKRHSKSLHLLTVNQIHAEAGAVVDKEKTRREAAKPDGFIEYTPGMNFRIEKNQDLSAGQMQLLQYAASQLERMGPNESLQGQGSASSGREVQARQQGGLIELGTHLDGLRALDRGVYRMSWSACQQYWTAPMFIRVTDNEDAPRFIGLNEPLMDQMGQIGGYQNNIAEMFVDVMVEDAPDVTTIEQEVWSDLTNIVPTLANLPPQMGELLIEASPLPASRKRRLVEIIRGEGQQAQAPDPLAQQAQQLAIAEKTADIIETRAKAQKAAADAAHTRAETMKTIQDAEIDAFEAAQRSAPPMVPIMAQ